MSLQEYYYFNFLHNQPLNRELFIIPAHSLSTTHFLTILISKSLFLLLQKLKKLKNKKLSAMDVLARASMKDAAKCDTHCELQISVNHQISERIWRCWDFPAARLFQCLLTLT